ncbi:copper resistance protein CopC [Nonomuraea sp. NPDC049607]|uniref:copper resistance CopC family protein n=1 Tax=Nonomuraea sp. NPDC049607 TaxID=3154732 RepID=UPI0034243CC0
MTRSLRSVRRPFRAACRAGVAVGGAVLLLLAAAPAALAHDRLKSSSPADGAKVAQVESIELEFTSRMTLPTLVLDGPAGENLPLGKPRAQGLTVKAEPAAPLEPGKYRLAWRVVSSDGHPISGELRFTVTAPATPTAEPAEATPTPSESPSETASASPAASSSDATSQAVSSSPVAQADAGTGSGGVPGWLWVAAAALVAGGAATVVAGRRRRGSGDTRPTP